jgi:hypothetical protein
MWRPRPSAHLFLVLSVFGLSGGFRFFKELATALAHPIRSHLQDDAAGNLAASAAVLDMSYRFRGQRFKAVIGVPDRLIGHLGH